MGAVLKTAPPALMALEATYATALPELCVPWRATPVPRPALVKFNTALARELGLDAGALAGETGVALLAGSAFPNNITPVAMAYSGHQFGGFSPRLGDGRALLLGECVDAHGRRRDVHLKGSGRTPFSRGGDGKAVLGPVLREYLMGEAMHALGVPTTRALAATATGERVTREGWQPGAVLARVAASHIRVGTFQFAAAHLGPDAVRTLADYAIRRHYPHLAETPGKYMAFFCAVRDAQAALVAQWMLLGFVHGVMNTDNMAISGETIDYGPCAFIDAYDPSVVFSSIDTHGRYAFGNQPGIAQWNLTRFAECLLPLFDEREDAAIAQATEALEAYPDVYRARWLEGMRRKLGMAHAAPEDGALARGLLALLQSQRVDYTRFFRQLLRHAAGQPHGLPELFGDLAPLNAWLADWQARVAPGADVAAMRASNPVTIPRNHVVEHALGAAVAGDLAPFDLLLEALMNPFEERAEWAEFALGAPEGAAPHVTFCGT